jgi:putative flippase GtrA
MDLVPEHLEKTIDRARLARFIQYGLVGAIGLAINEATLFLSTGIIGASVAVGGFIARVVSVFFNYILNDRWTWKNDGQSGIQQWLWRGFKYGATRIVGIAIGTISLVVFVQFVGLHYLVANILAVGVGALYGFGISERWVWKRKDEAST